MTDTARAAMPTPGNGRLESLTGIRFFAASAVLLVHLQFLWSNSHVIAHMNEISRQGASGVSLFFILSGFVMAWSHRPDDTPRAFYRRRVARIVPAYLVALVLFVPVDAYAGRLTGASVGRGLFNITLLQAWIPSPGWFSGGNPVGWSLSAEALFYAVFPVLARVVAALSMRHRRMLLVALLSAAIIVPLLIAPSHAATTHQLGWSYWAVYISPVTRLLEFAIGITAGTLLRDGARTRVPLWAAALLAVVAYLAAGQAPVYASYVAVTVVPFALLIVVAAETDMSGRRSFLRHRAVVKLGEWSYAFYLVHALLVRALGVYVDGHDEGLATRGALGVLVVLVSWGLAAALYRFVERPMERRLRKPRSTADQVVVLPAVEGVHV